MDVDKQRLVVEAAIPVVGAAFALQQRLKKITSSLGYFKMMALADEKGLAVGSADKELTDVEIALEQFTKMMVDINAEGHQGH
jgi:hypothetical protein